MQVSIENLSTLERRMTVAVPAQRIETQVGQRLKEAAKTVQLKGFRKGKVPMKVVQDRFGASVRQEVLGELVSQTYYEALTQQKIRPAGNPQIEPKVMEAGKDLEFIATFEVFPEVTVGDLSKVEVIRKTAEITDADLDKMIETLRTQRQIFQDVDRAATNGDQLNIDFVGTFANGEKAGEEFSGGTAKGTKLVLGSGRMINGFESGLVGTKKGEECKLSLTFPENYHSEDLAGRDVEFKVTVNSVQEPILPALDDTFFASFDVKEGGMEKFRAEVKSNMARELKNAVKNSVRNQIIDGLVGLHKIELPKSLVEGEINTLRQQTLEQYGGSLKNIDTSMLPAELFKEQAERRVTLGLVMNELVQIKNLSVDAAKVRSLVEEMAESYEQPDEVVKWYYSNKEQMQQIESIAMEEAVIETVLEAAKISETVCSYEEALKPVEKAAEKLSEEG
jgi:trigger factor